MRSNRQSVVLILAPNSGDTVYTINQVTQQERSLREVSVNQCAVECEILGNPYVSINYQQLKCFPSEAFQWFGNVSTAVELDRCVGLFTSAFCSILGTWSLFACAQRRRSEQTQTITIDNNYYYYYCHHHQMQMQVRWLAFVYENICSSCLADEDDDDDDG